MLKKMKIKKINNFNILQIIEANASMPSVKKHLESNFKFLNLKFLNSPNYIKYFLSWEEDKKNNFIKLIGGKANFEKTKKFLEKKALEINYESK